MAQYLENVLKYDRLSQWKRGSERLRMFFDATPGVQSERKADRADSNQCTKIWKADMNERLGGG